MTRDLKKIPALLTLMLLLAMAPAARAQESGTAERPAPDVDPTLTSFVEAEYPPAALRAGREGRVLLQLLVNASGAVDSVAVLESLEPELDAAAMRAAAACGFTPALIGGEPVPVLVQFAYTFSLARQAPELDPRVNLAGRVLERNTEKPIAGALVAAGFTAPDTAALPVPWAFYLDRLGRLEGQYRDGAGLVTIADSTGHFAFRALPPGRIALTFPNAGFAPVEIDETVRPDERLEVTVRLQRHEFTTHEVVVYGRRPEKEVSRQSLSTFEVERLPGFGGDVIKSLQALPGVARPTHDRPGRHRRARQRQLRHALPAGRHRHPAAVPLRRREVHLQLAEPGQRRPVSRRLRAAVRRLRRRHRRTQGTRRPRTTAGTRRSTPACWTPASTPKVRWAAGFGLTADRPAQLRRRTGQRRPRRTTRTSVWRWRPTTPTPWRVWTGTRARTTVCS